MKPHSVIAACCAVLAQRLPGDHIHARAETVGCGMVRPADPLTTFSVKREAEMKRQRKAAQRRATLKG